MLPLPLEVRAGLACGAAALILGAGLWVMHHERSVGAAQCRADKDALVATYSAREAQARADRQQQAASAAADFEATKARSAAALANTRAALQSALQRPICTPHAVSEPDHAQTLADLPIPADAVEKLRSAGENHGP